MLWPHVEREADLGARQVTCPVWGNVDVFKEHFVVTRAGGHGCVGWKGRPWDHLLHIGHHCVMGLDLKGADAAQTRGAAEWYGALANPVLPKSY